MTDDLWVTLVRYLVEQTGLPSGVVQRVLDAQNRFWESHQHLIEEIETDDEDGEAPA
jgi:hypothetical protein